MPENRINRRASRINRIIDRAVEEQPTVANGSRPVPEPTRVEGVPVDEGLMAQIIGAPNVNTVTIDDLSASWRTYISEAQPVFYTSVRRSTLNYITGMDSDGDVEEVTNMESSTKLVTTIDKKKHPKNECFCTNGKYWHKSHKDIFVDAIDGSFIHRDYAHVIIGKLSVVDGKPVIKEGYINNKNAVKAIPIHSAKLGIDGKVANISDIEGWEYKESTSIGCLVDADFKEQPISSVKVYDQFKNFHNHITDVKESMRLGKISPSYTIAEGLKYTFGIELEMSRGFLPSWKAARHYNVSCVRDGSVNPDDGGGPEIVTGILTGDTGINHLQDLCLELSKRTRVNATCGYHLHLGNIDFTPKFLINSYRLALLLEKEIFSTLPQSRRNNVYCKKLKKFTFRPAIGNTKENLLEIEEDYNTLFKYISCEKASNPTFDYNKDKQHPLGPKCGYNRDTPRYCWLNYVPAVFNTRGNNSYSLEVRHHSGTTNFTKIKNWLLFFMAFAAFAERYPELINPGITMDDILNKILPKKAKSLIMYFNNRKELFADAEMEQEEYKNIDESKKTIKELINN